MSRVNPRSLPVVLSLSAALGLALAACSGEIISPANGGAGVGSSAGTTGNSGGPSGQSQSLRTIAIQNAPDKAISRLTNAQWVASARALLGDAAVVGADALLPEQDRNGAFLNTGYAQDQAFDLIQGFDTAASLVVNQVPDWTSFNQRFGACAQASCINTFVAAFAEAAFRRPVTSSEVSAFQPIIDASAAAQLSYVDTVKLIVRATLQAPDFLYLILDDTLTDYQLAARLSYFISDGPPDAELYAAAKSGQLHLPAILDQQVDRLLTANVSRFAAAFGYDYLDLHRATTRNLTADPTTVLALMDSATSSFAALVEDDRPVSEILTTDTFVTNPTAATWLEGRPSTDTIVKPSPAYPFLGLLTHPATLMAMSNAVFGSTVSRGLFVANQMLCVPPTPPPPAGIQMTDLSALLPPNPTQRDEAEARIKDARCSGCHSQFETFSFGLNKWGGDGEYKNDPTLKDNGPVATALGEIAFNSYADYLPQLGGSAQFTGCVIDQVIRYGLQHTEYPTNTLGAAVLADASNRSPTITFRALMKALIRQPIFTVR